MQRENSPLVELAQLVPRGPASEVTKAMTNKRASISGN